MKRRGETGRERGGGREGREGGKEKGGREEEEVSEEEVNTPVLTKTAGLLILQIINEEEVSEGEVRK